MPNMFTSNEFTQRAILNGLPRPRKNCGLGEFIELHAVNEYRGSKTWNKKQVIKHDIEVLELNEKSCIDFLKLKGYKILKPINQFEEV